MISWPFAASGWSATRIDGHDTEAVALAIETARASDRPSLIACRTVIGFGAPNRQGSEKAHGAPLGAEEAEITRRALSWPYSAFEIPDEIGARWRESAEAGRQARRAWLERTRRLCGTGR